MRKTPFIFPIFLLLCGCGELQEKQPELGEALHGFLFRYKFAAGDEVRYFLGSSVSSQTLGDDPNAMSVEHEVEFSQKVLNVSPGGGARMAVAIDKLRSVLSGPTRDGVVLDSEDARSLTHCPPEMRGLAFLVGKKIEIEQTPLGEIVGVSGLAAIYRDAHTTLSLNERQPVERFLREMSHKPKALLGLGVAFPWRTVRVGERWSPARPAQPGAETAPFPMFCGQLKYYCDYALKQITDGVAIVEFGGELGTGESRASSRMQPVKTAKVRGTFSFDLQQGILTAMRGESSSFLHVAGSEQLRTKTSWELVLKGHGSLEKPPTIGADEESN